MGIEFNSATKSKETRNKNLGRENILPTNEQTARELVLSRPQFEITDDLLHHVESDNTSYSRPDGEAI